MRSTPSPASRLRALLDGPDLLVAPGCGDALSAKLIEDAGFPLIFMSGFAVAAARNAVPDTGLLTYTEMLETGRAICDAVDTPVIGDADTGYGNAVSVKRTIGGYAAAGFACAMIEDQLAPKQCGHTRGKQTVGRDEAYSRLQAAVDARDEGADIVIMARTDARATDGLDEAIARCQAFREIGADITFLEAPTSEAEMRAYCDAVDGPKMANLVDDGDTPLLLPDQLADIGYKIAIRPLTVMLAALAAMRDALGVVAAGQNPTGLASFTDLQATVGFPEYFAEADRYRA